MKIRLFSIFLFSLISVQVLAGDGVDIKRIGEPKDLFSTAIWAGDTLYISGILADPDTPGDPSKGVKAAWSSDTRMQGLNALHKIEKILSAQGLTMADVVQMQVFLTGASSKEGAMDFDGWNSAYNQFFGSARQPERPARATIQVAALAAPGALVEVMVVAVRSKK